MTALKVYGVVAPDELRLVKRIAGGTAEGLPFVPICGMMGFFYCHNSRRYKLPFRRRIRNESTTGAD